MNNINFLSTEDELIYAIRDLRKLLFLSECNDLYRRDLIPNLLHNSCYYDAELLDELGVDLIDLMNKKAKEIDTLTDNLFEWYRDRESGGEDAPPERAGRAGGASPSGQAGD